MAVNLIHSAQPNERPNLTSFLLPVGRTLNDHISIPQSPLGVIEIEKYFNLVNSALYDHDTLIKYTHSSTLRVPLVTEHAQCRIITIININLYI